MQKFLLFLMLILTNLICSQANEYNRGYIGFYNEHLKDKMHPVSQNSFKAKAKILVDQEEIYPRALEMIRSAKEQILFDMYLFGGDIADSMLEILKEKQAEGVIIRLVLAPVRKSEKNRIFNSLYELENSNLTFSYPVEEGFEVLKTEDEYVKPPYRPRVLKAIQMGLPVVHANPKYIPNSGLVRINHQKLLVVDGKRALIGGMNFATTVATNHDTMVEIAGPFIQELEYIFKNTWNLGLPENDSDILHFQAERAYSDMQSLSEEDGWYEVDAFATLTAPYIKNTKEELIKRIDQAKEIILVEQLLFNDTDTLKALVSAAKRGVKVRLVLDPAKHLYGYDWYGGPNNVAVAIVQALENELDIKAKHYKIKPGQELHTKLIVIDNNIVGLGSTNFTGGAFNSNLETFVFFEGEGLTKAYTDFFMYDWHNESLEIEELSELQKLIGKLSSIIF